MAVFVKWKKSVGGQQRGARTCPHFDPHPTVLTPQLWVSGGGQVEYLCQIGPRVRNCCITFQAPLALAAWWSEVELRIDELSRGVGVSDVRIGRALHDIRDDILGLLAETVPYPGKKAMRDYRRWQKKTGAGRPRRRCRVSSLTFMSVLKLTEWPVSEDVLKKRWREIAIETHPDRGGDPAQFIAAQQAYSEALEALEVA